MSVFPFFKQHDSMDCGPTCLRMVAMHYGKNYSLQSLRSRSFISRSGVSMLGISNAAEEIGFRTLGYRLVNRKKKYSDFGKMKCSKFGNKSAVFLGTILQ